MQGSYNAVWVRGKFGADTFYYGRGAGPHPTGVAVVSDLMRVAREIRSGSPERVSPFAHPRLGEYKPIPVTSQKSAYYLRFRVVDRPGIIAALSKILADKHISLDAVLQLPSESKDNLPFVITVEPTSEKVGARGIGGDGGIGFHGGAAARDADGGMGYESSRCSGLHLQLAAQVAEKANERYKTPEAPERDGRHADGAGRDARQKPRELVAELGIKPGMTVVDLGTGPGYMLPYLSTAVGPQGRVIGGGYFPGFPDKARERATGLKNVSFVLGTAKETKLAGEIGGSRPGAGCLPPPGLPRGDP